MKYLSKIHWPAVFILSSVPILMLLTGIVIDFFCVLYPGPARGIEDVTIEFLVFHGALYFALPCSLLNITAGTYTITTGLAKKRIAIPVIIIGIIGFLIGLAAWIWFFMVASFTSHFS